jgi:hypothetical protein
VAKKEQMKKTLNAQRSTSNVEIPAAGAISNIRQRRSVAAGYRLPMARTDCQWRRGME